MMTQQEMVLELWDREKIKELTYAYGLAIEDQDAERMASLFRGDASIDFSSISSKRRELSTGLIGNPKPTIS